MCLVGPFGCAPNLPPLTALPTSLHGTPQAQPLPLLSGQPLLPPAGTASAGRLEPKAPAARKRRSRGGEAGLVLPGTGSGHALQPPPSSRAHPFCSALRGRACQGSGTRHAALQPFSAPAAGAGCRRDAAAQPARLPQHASADGAGASSCCSQPELLTSSQPHACSQPGWAGAGRCTGRPAAAAACGQPARRQEAGTGEMCCVGIGPEGMRRWRADPNVTQPNPCLLTIPTFLQPGFGRILAGVTAQLRSTGSAPRPPCAGDGGAPKEASGRVSEERCMGAQLWVWLLALPSPAVYPALFLPHAGGAARRAPHAARRHV